MTLSNFKYYFLLTILALALFLPGISTIPVLDRDEAHFAQATRQMVETNNYWQINFQQEARHLKPPGIYWLQAIAVKAFGNSDSDNIWPYRLPSLLGALVSILATFYFAKTFYSEKIAFFAAALLGSTVLLNLEAHQALTDSMLLATMVLMQGALWKIYVQSHKKQNSSWQLVLLFWFAMAFGILIKGITPLVGFLTLITLAIIDKNLTIFREVKFLRGFLFLLLLSAIWLIPFSIAGKSNFLWDMIHGDVMPKLFNGQQSHGMPPGYFILIFTIMFFPGSLFIWHGILAGWQNRTQPTEKFLLAWIIPTWIFFELVRTKLPEYVLPTYPAIAVLIAKGVCDWQKIKWGKVSKFFNWLQYLLWGLTGLAIAMAFIYIPHLLAVPLTFLTIAVAVIIVITVLGALLCIYTQSISSCEKAQVKSSSGVSLEVNEPRDRLATHSQLERRRVCCKKYQPAVATAIIGFAIAFFPVWQVLLPNLKPLWLNVKIVNAVEKYNAISPEQPLISIGYDEPSLVFLTGTSNVIFTDPQQAPNLLHKYSKGLVLISGESLKYNNISLKILDTIKGFNYSKGEWVDITLYQYEKTR